MKNEILKTFTLIGVIIVSVLAIIFGSYLPLVKSQLYIDALSLMPSVKTIQEFEANFDKALKYYSPVGDEEVIKYLTSTILQIASQQNQPEAVDRALTSYIEPYLFKNDVRHLLAGAQLHETLLNKYKHPEDLQKTDSYIQAAYAIGPKLPPVLYNLFDIYRIEGNISKAKEIGQTILLYWSDNKAISDIVKTL